MEDPPVGAVHVEKEPHSDTSEQEEGEPEELLVQRDHLATSTAAVSAHEFGRPSARFAGELRPQSITGPATPMRPPVLFRTNRSTKNFVQQTLPLTPRPLAPTGGILKTVEGTFYRKAAVLHVQLLYPQVFAS